MLRIGLLLVILFFVFQNVDFDDQFDQDKPSVQLYQNIKGIKKPIDNSKILETSLNETSGIKIDISDNESKLSNVELFFKNESTNNKFLRFYNKFYINSKTFSINLNKTILKNSVFGTHLTEIQVIAVDDSFNKNKKTFNFKITNNITLPSFSIQKRSLKPFIPGNVDWAIIKTNKSKIATVKSSSENVSIKKINKNTFGLLFFHTNNNNYKITIEDIYGNKFSKNIEFLKLKNISKNVFENPCFNTFKKINVTNTPELQHKLTEKYSYSKGSSISDGVGLVKGKCNSIPYILYSTNVENINHLFYGFENKLGTKTITKNHKLKNDTTFIGDFILFKNEIFDTSSYVNSINSIF